MERMVKHKVVAGAVAALAVGGGGAALAATQFGSPKEESQAIVNDAAKELGVQPSKLSDALKKALENRVDAAVTAGRLTKEQGADLKAKIASGDVPIFLGPRVGGFDGPHGFGFAADLGAAAGYLGLTDAELRSQLESGKTLAQVAKDKGKSVDGLVTVLYDASKKRLDEAVAAGRLTKDREASILADLKQHLTDLVNNGFPGPPDGDRFGDRFGGDRFGGDRFGGRSRGGPPGFLLPSA